MARRRLEVFLLLTCAAVLVAFWNWRETPEVGQPTSAISISHEVFRSTGDLVPHIPSIGGVQLGMSREQVETILGTGPHDQWPTGLLEYTEDPPVYVSYDEHDQVHRLAGVQLELNGSEVLHHPFTQQQLLDVLGQADTLTEETEDGKTWQVHHFERYQATLRTGETYGAPIVLEEG